MENFVLIGYMGCGKTTIGIKLSYVLKQPFIDTDSYIEQKEGMAISQIFETYGEDYFRDLETKCLVDLKKEKTKCVLSVGGGLPVREENQRLLKEFGKVIYLEANADTIYERIKDDDKRPLLQVEDPYQKIATMIRSRKEYYEASADYILSVDGKNIEEIIKEIVQIMEKEKV